MSHFEHCTAERFSLEGFKVKCEVCSSALVSVTCAVLPHHTFSETAGI